MGEEEAGVDSGGQCHGGGLGPQGLAMFSEMTQCHWVGWVWEVPFCLWG